MVDARLASTDTMARSCWWIPVRVALIVDDSVDCALPDAREDGTLRVCDSCKGNISGERLALGLVHNPPHVVLGNGVRFWLRAA